MMGEHEMMSLPDEMLILILQHIGISDMRYVFCVCRRFHHLCHIIIPSVLRLHFPTYRALVEQCMLLSDIGIVECTEGIKWFVRAGVDVNHVQESGDEREERQWTLLTRAAYFGHTRTVTELIRLNADVNLKVQFGTISLPLAPRSALFIASRERYTDVVDTLISAGADITEDDAMMCMK